MDQEDSKYDIKTYSSEAELARSAFADHLQFLFPEPNPVSGALLNSKSLSHTVYGSPIQTADVMGSVVDSKQLGPNTAVFHCRIYDPFNRHRKIIAFDTLQVFQILMNRIKCQPVDEIQHDDRGHLTCRGL